MNSGPPLGHGSAVPALVKGPWHALQPFTESWYQVKTAIEHRSIVASDALHVLVGMAVWIAAALLLRKRLSSLVPWLLVLATIVMNESVDLTKERWPNVWEQRRESLNDLLLTMVLPTLLLLLIRGRPDLFHAERAKRRR